VASPNAVDPVGVEAVTTGTTAERPRASAADLGRSTFLSYFLRKLLAAVVSFAVTLIIGFILFSIMPADPVGTLTRGRPVSAAQLEHLKQTLGVDQPIWHRFLTFVGHTLSGNLGYSWQYQQSVAGLIQSRIWPTLLLTGSSTLLSIVLGLWLGARSGWRPGKILDRISSGVSLTLWSVPTFWLGIILLVLFSVGFGPIPALFPAGGMSTPDYSGSSAGYVIDVIRHLVLPCLTLVLVVFAQYVTIMRSSIIDELGSPYLLTARAKGLRDEVVRRKHAVPNALLPSVTVIFLQIGGLVGGAITVETVYSWPGLGYLTFQALRTPDLPLLEGTFIVFSASIILMNLVADVLYRYLDPRVRAQ
jgi:peptide/nickel transport system permease protein